MSLNLPFPKYTEYNPSVPVWCLTPNEGRCFHRFFDSSPISPSGRYLAVFRMPFEDRLPEPGDAGEIVIVDLHTGIEKTVATTCGWETQLGPNINWGADDHALLYNDVDMQTWKPFSWKLDFLRGTKQRFDSTVYHVSPDGEWMISADMTNTRRTQGGYGVVVPNETAKRNIGLCDDDGFWLTNTDTGESKLVITSADMFAQANPDIDANYAEQFEIYGFHSKFNDRGDRLAVHIRWFKAESEPQWDVMSKPGKTSDKFSIAWLTCDLDGGNVKCAAGPECWVNGGNHPAWAPGGDEITMNLNLNGTGIILARVNQDGTDMHAIHPTVKGSGHPTFADDMRHMITDCYEHESQFSTHPGVVPLRWIDTVTGAEEHPVQVYIHQEGISSPLRLDPHPAWARIRESGALGGTGEGYSLKPIYQKNRYIIFNGFSGNTRRVYLADFSERCALTENRD